ncbi:MULTISPECIES: aldehyde dehydrogenase family protein [unclassified Caballeronia]|uniref:aldehyde dehydrogenase family protein n=1 Tax=unclassified Caballeronia TaxID=2646786 RepID=UPI00285BB374|nr:MULTISPECIES: aldehyde dehydrogenase family protein [unclassified Caballeronia]MDR5750714.1 aldehyde dehydrogenase family protein [Caballeronia sp. LZ024]MDR5842254.1 aldehyde dehydrogenase family protein [Caballeronia sp. LZ031]
MTARKPYAILDKTRAFIAAEKCMLIDGTWHASASGETIDVTNPADGSVLCRVPAAHESDVDRAVQAARRAFDDSAWSRMKPSDRERLLLRAADAIEANARELAELEALDNGKPVAVAEALDVSMAAHCFRYMAGWATKIEGSTVDASIPYSPSNAFFAYTRKEAVGVVGAIIPWNFPLLMAAWKLAPALAAGCTVVLKPAEDTPLSALRLGELLTETGFPAGVVNIVTGYGRTAGAALASHPGLDKIAFTGSTPTGRAIGHAALDNMTRMSLELGGKSPVIVLPDVDIDKAAEGVANAIFFNSGQVCTAGSRVYVHDKVFDRVMERVAAIAKSMKIGPGLDPATQIGPLVSARQLDRVLGYIDAGHTEGARAIAGGRRGEGAGFFVEPTVLVDTDHSMRVVREEIFGPVLVAMRFKDTDAVIAQANDTPYGLGASIWSNDLSAVHKLIPRIRAGTVWVNCHSLLDNAMPFGGFKQSGFGRELGRAAIDMYTETKSVLINHA